MSDGLYHSGATRGQSVAARRARLERGACPIHGLEMSQISGFWSADDGIEYTTIACPRRDCNMVAIAGPLLTSPDWHWGDVTLARHCEYVLVEGGEAQ